MPHSMGMQIKWINPYRAITTMPDRKSFRKCGCVWFLRWALLFHEPVPSAQLKRERSEGRVLSRTPRHRPHGQCGALSTMGSLWTWPLEDSRRVVFVPSDIYIISLCWASYSVLLAHSRRVPLKVFFKWFLHSYNHVTVKPFLRV